MATLLAAVEANTTLKEVITNTTKLSPTTHPTANIENGINSKRYNNNNDDNNNNSNNIDNVQQRTESDSGKSAHDCSFDSGIAVMDSTSSTTSSTAPTTSTLTSTSTAHDAQLKKRLQQCKRILLVLNRDQEAYRLLRARLSKIIDKKNKQDATEEQICNVCCAEIDASDPKSFVTCCICKKRICRNIKCANWQLNNAQWECELCHSSKESLAQTSSWVAEQMSFNQQKFIYPMRARSEIYIPISDCHDSSMHFESVSQLGVNTSAISAEDKVKIREYVEELVANMLGGSLDKIRVGQLSKSETYLQLFDKYHSKLCNLLINMENALCANALKGDLPAIINGHNNANNNNDNHNNNSSQNVETSLVDVSQAHLRQLIESIIAETLRTGNLTANSGAVSEITLNTRSNGDLSTLSNGNVNGIKRRHRTEHYFEPKIYQDLLATAVLNKISDKEGNTRLFSESTPDLSARNIDENYNVEALSTSGSSIEPRSDCSLTDHELVHNADKIDSHVSLEAALERESVLNDYIAAHMVPLPDISASVTESEDDIASMASSMIGEGTWEDNWLFKKKRSNLPSSTTSSSMLVPAPKENVRAQIGDKTADEVSDLSEIGSDTDDSSFDLMRCNELNDRLLNKHLIGGQNTKLALDEIMDGNSMISNTLPEEDEPLYADTKNTSLITATKADISNEITLKLKPEEPTAAPPPPMHFDDENNVTNPIAGSIAERECKKWYNAVEMPNNPYAPEALKQRISGHLERCMDVPNISPSTEQNPLTLITEKENKDVPEQGREPDYKRYSRDYYINEAQQTSSKSHTPTELNKSSPTDQSDAASASANEDDIVINEAQNNILTVNEPTKTADGVKQSTVQAAEESSSSSLYKALPAQVVDENASSIETLSTPSMQSLRTTTSDSDTVQIYDFKKQETIIIREATTTKISENTETSSSMESALSSQKETAKKRERPKVLPLGGITSDSSSSLGSPKTGSGSRGSTPPAFKFLQPKRKLIDPSQVLSIDEDEGHDTTTAAEKPVIEQEVAHAMPSVKALAKAFLITSKSTHAIRRWPTKAKGTRPVTPETPEIQTTATRRNRLEPCASMAEIADEATIASDLSSLETDPSISIESPLQTIPEAQDPGKTSPVPVRTGFLRSNIAFFENLKFK